MKSSSSATSSPVAPPPPPPPPPPQLELDEEMKLMAKEAAALVPKKMDFRDIFALFHNTNRLDASVQERAWESLWTATFAEAQEEHRLQRKLGHRSAPDDSSRGGKSSNNSGIEPPKRPRQVRQQSVHSLRACVRLRS